MTLIDLYTLLSDVQRNANDLHKEIADTLSDRLHHDRPVSGSYGSVQRTARTNHSLKDDEAVLDMLESAGIDRDRVLSVDRGKVDDALEVTDVAESDVYETEKTEYVRKAELDEDRKETRLQGLKDQLAASDADDADQLRDEVEELESRIEEPTEFKSGQMNITRRKALISLCAAGVISLSSSLFPYTMRVGVYDESGPQAHNQGKQFNEWIGGNLEVQNIFIPWDDAGVEINELFNQTVPSLWATDYDPMLTWELYLTSGPTPDDILSRVATGEYDSYIEDWAQQLQLAAIRSSVSVPTVYLRLAHEMNGDWYPWAPAGGDGTPQEYIRMWRRVWSIVEEQTGEEVRIRWVWAANNVDVGEFAMEELYPGREYVDWLGIDGYNWGDSQPWSEWQSPEKIFKQPIQRLKELSNRPLAVTEFGSTSLTNSGRDIQQKSEWIIRAFDTLADLGVSMCIWFNENKETDWPVFDGQRGDELVTIDGRRYQSYAAFRNAVKKYT